MSSVPRCRVCGKWINWGPCACDECLTVIEKQRDDLALYAEQTQTAEARRALGEERILKQEALARATAAEAREAVLMDTLTEILRRADAFNDDEEQDGGMGALDDIAKIANDAISTAAPAPCPNCERLRAALADLIPCANLSACGCDAYHEQADGTWKPTGRPCSCEACRATASLAATAKGKGEKP